MTAQPRVLVVSDGETPHVVAAVRALARGGFDVGVASPEGSARRAARSRYSRRWHHVPPVQDSVSAYLDAVAAALGENGYAVVLPGDDADLFALSWGRDRLPALLPYAGHDVIVSGVDKLELTRLGSAAGLGTPGTVVADDANVETAELPLVVKARVHWSPDAPADDRHVFAVECDTRDEVRDAVAAMRAVGGEPILQQRVDGSLMAVSVVLDRDGSLLAAAQQESQRLSLRRTSVLARTVPVDPDLVERVRAMLADLGWFGLANLQFLRGADGVPQLIDLNGRFYGSIALAVAAGADLPSVWVRAALGQPRGPVQTARPGVRFQALEEDLRRARTFRDGGLVRDVARAFAAAPRSVHTSWSPRDPGPALARLRALGRTAAGRLR